jgi:putative transposase
MRKNKREQAVSPEHEMRLTLDDLARRGARQLIQQAIETELAELLASCASVRTIAGQASCRAQRLSAAAGAVD